MDENQTNESSKLKAYASLLSTALAVGFVIGVGITTGSEVSKKTAAKIVEIRKERKSRKLHLVK